MIYLSMACIGTLGWFIAKKLKAPAPSLLGPMLFIGIVKIAGFNMPQLPRMSVSLFQLVLGIFVGMRVTRSQFKLLKNKKSLYTFIIILIWTIASSIVSAHVLVRFTDLDLATALLAGTPGGMAEMSVAAFSYGADVPTVALLQLIRLSFIVSFVSFYLLSLKRRKASTIAKVEEIAIKEVAVKKKIAPEILACGLLLGIFLIYIKFPAGGLVGAIIGVGASSIILDKSAYLPKHIQISAQIGIGISIGMGFTKETFMQLTRLIGPMIVLPLFMVVSGILLAYIVEALTKWEIGTCILCTAPAGLSQMVILAEDMDTDIFLVSLFQTTRLLTIYLILPQIFSLYLR